MAHTAVAMFKKLLIANRGEIALRIMRACKELGTECVAIHSGPDVESLHVNAAFSQGTLDFVLPTPTLIGGGVVTNAYVDMPKGVLDTRVGDPVIDVTGSGRVEKIG